MNKEHRHTSVTQKASRALAIIFGSVLMAVGLHVFLLPNEVIDGGITGIAIMLSYLTGWKLGIFLFVLNLPFFYIGYKQIGKTFAFSTLLGITTLSITTSLLHGIPVFQEDMLLATVFGGISIGAGVGIVIRYGGSLDGTEILAILINKKIPFSVGETIMFFNVFILGTSGFVFGWNHAMYSLITYFVAFKTIDVVVQGLDEMKFAWIISNHDQEIGDAILHRLGRGVTYVSGEGGYTGEGKRIITCIITRLEEAKLKTLIHEIDTSALLAISNISEVQGGNLKKKDIH